MKIKRRKKTETQSRKGQQIYRGANTPVSVMVRRLQNKIQKEKSHITSRQQFQPTLRSFIELRGGFVGSRVVQALENIQRPALALRQGRDPSVTLRIRTNRGLEKVGGGKLWSVGALSTNYRRKPRH